jgi:hypothetical protein
MTLNINTGFRSVADHEADKFDVLTRSVSAIDSTHRMTHEGFLHHTSGKLTGLLDTGVQDVLISVPAATFPHFHRATISFGAGDIDIVVSEGATTSDDGTPSPVFNTNRNSAIANGTQIFIDPTVTGVGTVFHTQWAVPTAAGIGASEQGIANVTSGEEWILKPSTKYLLRITNNSGSTIDMRYELFWYEIKWEQKGQ